MTVPVALSGNLKKEKVMIDANGNEVVPFTKRVVKVAEENYSPTKAELDALAAKKGGEEKLSKEEIAKAPGATAINIKELINKKVNELVEKKIAEALEELFK
jgi:hypothetical protein